ncbi:MAG TPA: DUF3300 domain-containing protein [Reyranella sp.]|nr:DUF3300 domain-containing protein [Reyranella sp.]
MHAQASTAPAAGGTTSATPASSAAASGDKLSNAQLDQLLAPIALYPDGLLAQVTMAATYPLEVVEAARWSKDNPNLKGDAAVQACKDKGWDPTVQSLVAFPQVLAMMNSKLDWTTKLGNAMLDQQSDVAGSIQRLRKQAQDAGKLPSTAQQTVKTQALTTDAPAGTPPAIVIEPANPQTVYVPVYNPTYVYGAWPYPAYPPIYFPPPAWYGVGPGWLGGLAFGIGIGVGIGFFGGWRWGGGWGGGWGWGGWHGGNSYTTINSNITHIDNHYRYDPNNNHWNHDPAHRHGVPYPPPLAGKYGQRHPTPAGRQAWRGEIGREPGPVARPAETPRAGGYGGYQDRGAAFSGVDHGARVNREAERGLSYNHQPYRSDYHSNAYHGWGGGGWGGGRSSWHGGGGRR